MKTWHNTGLVDSLQLPASGAAWLLGDGVFESLRTYELVPFELERHLERLSNSLEFLQINGPTTPEIASAVKAVIAANPYSPYGRLRIAVYSDGQWIITHTEFLPSAKPLSLHRYQGRRFSESMLARVKSASYAESSLALRLATAQGFDDAIFVNEREEVVETALANLIWLEDEQWFTPTLQSGCLPGVTRALLIENFGVHEGVLPVSEIQSVRALALTSSVREIVAIERYESNLYPTSQPLQELQASFHAWVLGKLHS